MKRLVIGFDTEPHGTLSIRNGKLHAEGPNVEAVKHHAHAAAMHFAETDPSSLTPENILARLADTLQSRTWARWEDDETPKS
jgi:hypothetical protein